MLDEALRRLRFDKRLIGRRGWTPREEIERELASLPDVSDKIAPTDEEPQETRPTE